MMNPTNTKAIDTSKIDNFEKIPDSALSEVKTTIPGSPITEEEILGTGNHTKAEIIPEIPSSDTSKGPTPPNNTGNSGFGGNTGGQSAGNLIGAKQAIAFVDMLIAPLIVIVYSKVGYSISKSDFQLNQKEQDAISVPLQAWLDSIKIDLSNPLANLLFALAMVYGGKVANAAPNAKRKIRKSEQPEKSVTQRIIEEDKKQQTLYTIEGLKFSEEDKGLIEEVYNKRKKSRKDAIQWLLKKGQITPIK